MRVSMLADNLENQAMNDSAAAIQGNSNPTAEHPSVPPWKIWTLLAFPCLVSAAFGMRDPGAPKLSPSADRPSLVFDSYMRHEGPDPISSQPLLSPYFVFRNKGMQTVRIKELVPSCGCLAPEITSKEIPPGGDGRLTLPIKTRNEPAGLREYLVTVKYEDPKPREVALSYKVVLPEKQIEIEPRVLMVMGRISSTDRDIISISDHRPERRESPMKVTNVTSSCSIFTAKSAGFSAVDGVNRNAIEVTYSDSIPIGQHRGIITVSTDDATYPTLQIPVILGDRKRPLDEPVTVSPDSGRVIVLSATPEKSTGTSFSFSLPARWKVSHLETSPPQLIAKVEKTESETPDSSQVAVSVVLHELPRKGTELGSLILHAKDGEESEMVTVPVTLLWR